VTEYGNAGFHFDQTPFRRRKIDVAREEKGGKSLQVSASQPGVGPKNALGDNWLLDQALLTLRRMEMASVIVPVCQLYTNRF
jgi:hypothetical protein